MSWQVKNWETDTNLKKGTDAMSWEQYFLMVGTELGNIVFLLLESFHCLQCRAVERSDPSANQCWVPIYRWKARAA